MDPETPDECLTLECGDACCVEGEVCFDAACCSPDCTDKDCGQDGCGGDCGECPTGQVCDASGMCGCEFEMCGEACCADGEDCLADVCCAPDCEGKDCGDDGCGGSCGKCPENTECGGNGLCECLYDECAEACCEEEEVCFEDDCCLPDCEGSSCGSDGCGGSCGECGEFSECSEEGSCVCLFEECLEVCCDDGRVCFEDACCLADCEGKVCGDDGCGGSCGECTGPQELCDSGACVCQPVCDGLDCGEDGCGGSCGECQGEWSSCEVGVCIETCADLSGTWWVASDILYDGLCFGQTEEDGLFFEKFEISRVAEEYIITVVGEASGKPSWYEFAECTYILDSCTLNCDCDNDCVVSYAAALEVFYGVKPTYDSGTVQAAFTLVDGVLSINGQDTLNSPEGTCVYSTVSFQPGPGQLCDACTGDHKECGNGLICGSYANFPTVSACIDLCIENADCPPGFECLDQGICWYEDSSFVEGCQGGDIWWTDVCSQLIGPVEECVPGTICELGECVACAPSCLGKECGDDGCNGLCGTCQTGEMCILGHCQSAGLNCQGDETPAQAGCELIDAFEGCCLGEMVVWCEEGATYCIDCEGGENLSCGWGESFYNCGTDGLAEPTLEFPKSCDGS